jgi:hypothetical protein
LCRRKYHAEDPQLRPDKHIFVEIKSQWFDITDYFASTRKAALLRLRQFRPKR